VHITANQYNSFFTSWTEKMHHSIYATQIKSSSSE